jgi:hypothetical protein
MMRSGDDYIAVPTDLVEYAIDVLRCYLAQWRQPEGIEPEDQAYNALAVAAGHALAGLLASRAAHNAQCSARQLIDQLDLTRHNDDPRIAEAIDDPAVITAMLALSKGNELAQAFVRWALAYQVARWHRLMTSAEGLRAPRTP